MSSATQQVVTKAWNFAQVLRGDVLSYMDYVEQITFLLFLKMADEQTRSRGGPDTVRGFWVPRAREASGQTFSHQLGLLPLTGRFGFKTLPARLRAHVSRS